MLKEKSFTVTDFDRAKISGKKITMLTAYDYAMAKILDEAGVDSILVGDSLGMVVLGYENTTKVTMEDMLHHTKAVARGVKRAFIIADLPFLTYHQGIHESVKNAGRLVSEGGCNAVKLEGGIEVAEDIKAIINAGIPVVGHLGYTPQSVNKFGAQHSQGKTLTAARKLLQDAFALQKAGVFSIVLECVPYKLAGYITSKLEVPVIGIGSGADCDGQVLVTPDMLGLFRDFKPRHSKVFFDMGSTGIEAVRQYINEVNSGLFPKPENSFNIDDGILAELDKTEV